MMGLFGSVCLKTFPFEKRILYITQNYLINDPGKGHIFIEISLSNNTTRNTEGIFLLE